jgi:putative ABC transport system substrate-binding protein
VFTTGSDPVRDGLAASLNRPGGNVTGVVFISGTLGAKRLELLRQFVPKTGHITMLVYPGIAETEAERAEVEAAAQVVGQQIRTVEIRNAAEIEVAVAAAVTAGAGAVLVGTGPFMFNNHVRGNGRSPRDSGDVFDARKCRSRRIDELRREHHRCLPPGWPLRGANP